MEPRTFSIVTYGCQMNRHDSAVLEGALRERGMEPAAGPEDADLVIFNTCAVRAHAEQRLFSNVGKLKYLKAKRPEVLIGVIGCVAQKEGAELIRRFPHVSFVAGTQAVHLVPGIIEEGVRENAFPRAETGLPPSPHPLPLPSSRACLKRPWSAYVAVMRGCNNFCTYCVVPYVRGREVSRPSVDIERDVRELIDRGVSEITLLGQNIDSYGKGLAPGEDLAGLLERLGSLEGLQRLRFITSHPRDISPRLIRAVAACEPVCEYFHVPPQAGGNRILKAMNRGYSRKRYLEVISMIRGSIPDAGIAGDFIVGFPGEREVDFQQTLSMAEEVRFQSAFIFKYSPRPGTRAAGMEDDVPPEEKSRRHAVLTHLQQEISLQRNREAVGRDYEVLIEGSSPRDPSRISGRTRDFRIVIMPGESGVAGEYVNVRIEAATPLALYAEGAAPRPVDEDTEPPEDYEQ